MIEDKLNKNPCAFKPRVFNEINEDGNITQVHKGGCTCKKSNCKKNYCLCFRSGVKCNEKCLCLDCKNCTTALDLGDTLKENIDPLRLPEQKNS